MPVLRLAQILGNKCQFGFMLTDDTVVVVTLHDVIAAPIPAAELLFLSRIARLLWVAERKNVRNKRENRVSEPLLA